MLAQQRPAAGHRDALVDDVGGDFRLRVLERGADDLDDLVDGFAQRVGDLRLGELDLAGHAAADVAAADQCRQPVAVAGPDRGADLQLHPLGGAFADQQIDSCGGRRS